MNKYSDILKRGVNATLYPLPFKKGGKMKTTPKVAVPNQTPIKKSGGVIQPRSFAPQRQLDFNGAVKMALGGMMGPGDPKPKPVVNESSPRFGADLEMAVNYPDQPISMLLQHNKPITPGKENTPGQAAIMKGVKASFPDNYPTDSLTQYMSPEQLIDLKNNRNRVLQTAGPGRPVKTKFSPNQ